MRSNNHRKSLSRKSAQQACELPAPVGVQVRRRLVEKERARILGNNHGQVGALKLTARDVCEASVAKTPHARELHGLAHQAAIPLA